MATTTLGWGQPSNRVNGLIARSLDLLARLTPEMAMKSPTTAMAEMTHEQVARQDV